MAIVWMALGFGEWIDEDWNADGAIVTFVRYQYIQWMRKEVDQFFDDGSPIYRYIARWEAHGIH